tara:strand:+ start:391 stop:567 length:177 start_codon:yes stop_codon:yes gene_type:complete
MSYLVTSNAEYHGRINDVEEKINKMVEKLELLEYNINILSTALNKEFDNISDMVRSLK